MLTNAEKRCLKALAQPGAYAYRKPRGVQYTIVGADFKVTGRVLWGLRDLGYVAPRSILTTPEFTITERGRDAIK